MYYFVKKLNIGEMFLDVLSFKVLSQTLILGRVQGIDQLLTF